MAARLNPQHDERTRTKIQTSQLVNRLMAHALGDVEMTPTQVRAAEVLLRKTLPDLSNVDQNVTGEQTVTVVVDTGVKRG
jgi:hypothetical protein